MRTCAMVEPMPLSMPPLEAGMAGAAAGAEYMGGGAWCAGACGAAAAAERVGCEAAGARLEDDENMPPEPEPAGGKAGSSGQADRRKTCQERRCVVSILRARARRMLT
ncbi:hypothetical protein EON67_09205, partial [archaeon]